MGLVDKALRDNRHADSAAVEAELRGPKGRGWLMRWLPACLRDNDLFSLHPPNFDASLPLTSLGSPRGFVSVQKETRS
jgi:hypothetical protein